MLSYQNKEKEKKKTGVAVVGDSNCCVVAGMNYKVRGEISVTLDIVCIVWFTRRV